ncbi:MTAP family purine nucleoside phosphorylase [Neobacillus thermocopriae]|jgi:5'-methylthioadenosine phosphorylase|uniref:MTAP family purine nucleoside phosphorylase n=1 Tax=Neobacillus thermocopriae TaxID=1215031 RepID=UPI002E1A8D58|nr:MTAP family purine nucleoside phosphorylase [Neobacillus thermocopriae]MED3713411.1 MTAP family purine nucleoside phosphorylase [Neobacillus thermocopriae]
MKLGIIGGTGFYHLFEHMVEKNIRTEYGDVTVFHATTEGKDVYFLPRHGKHHDTLAPFVNYRANMLALKELGVTRILSVSAVGAINPEIKVGSLSLLDQFVDLTTRVKTYGKYSVDLTEPFCPELQEVFVQAAKAINEPLRPKTTLVCVEGPRYETKAEVQLFSKLGMDVIGMTNATEAALARELGMCYSVVTLATNMAPGLTEHPLSLKAHREVVERKRETVKSLMLEAIKLVEERKRCTCHEAYERAMIAKP